MTVLKKKRGQLKKKAKKEAAALERAIVAAEKKRKPRLGKREEHTPRRQKDGGEKWNIAVTSVDGIRTVAKTNNGNVETE